MKAGFSADGLKLPPLPKIKLLGCKKYQASIMVQCPS
jgi:hypothetical protein